MLTPNEIRTGVTEWVRDKSFIKKVHLFGSYARGEQTERSDLDLMIQFVETFNDEEIYFEYHDNREKWSAELMKILNFNENVELHCYDLLSREWQDRHLEKSELIFTR